MLIIIIGAVAGGIAGYFFYKFIGCRTGACVLTSHPVRAIIYWGALGGLLAWSFVRK